MANGGGLKPAVVTLTPRKFHFSAALNGIKRAGVNRPALKGLKNGFFSKSGVNFSILIFANTYIFYVFFMQDR